MIHSDATTPLPRDEVPDQRTLAGGEMPEPDDEPVPGTGIFGDETLVKPASGVVHPGIAKEIPKTADENGAAS
jgi:hypothetical protein